VPATPFSYRQYAGNGSTTSFSVPFPYLLKAHVKAYLGFNILDGTFASELADGAGFTWSSGTQITCSTAPASGQTLTVIRQTPNATRLVDWQDGSNLIAGDLDTADLQNLYVVQEQQDRNDASVVAGAAAAAASASAASAAAASSSAAITTANQALAAASGVAASAAAASEAAALASAVSSVAVNLVFGQVPTPPRAMAGLEVLLIPENAAFSVGKPGQIPFGVGPVLPPGAAFSGITRSDYYPIHHASGSFV
jgi:hypothetical protein